MPVDGVFIHFLIEELRPVLLNERIFKFITISETSFLLHLSAKKSLFISLDATNPHIRLTTIDELAKPSHLSSFLKKHLEGGFIRAMAQHNNDRIITFEIEKADELGYLNKLYMIIELTGRSSNLIFTDSNYIILNSAKRSFITDARLIQIKAQYQYPQTGQSNPFLVNEVLAPLEGVSKLLNEEIYYRNDLNFLKTMTSQATYYTWANKTAFYAFDLTFLEADKQVFTSLSALLEFVCARKEQKTNQNNSQKQIDKLILYEIKKLEHKLAKQLAEFDEAKNNLELEQTANILASNLHLVKPYSPSIDVLDFYTNKPITIILDPKKRPHENLDYLYNKFKKAKRTIIILEETLKKTRQDLLNYQIMLTQAEDAPLPDLKEILNEIKPPKQKPKNVTPHFLRFKDRDNNLYFVGKNNIQNSYLTHEFALKSDYFFHVVNYPAAHVILRGDLNAHTIKNAAQLACFYTKIKGSLPVDYTLVKWVKKIKGQKSSFVTYTNQQQIITEGNPIYLKENLEEIRK